MRKLYLLIIVTMCSLMGSVGSLASMQAQASTTLSMYGGKWTSVYPSAYFELLITPIPQKTDFVKISMYKLSPTLENKEQVLSAEIHLTAEETGSFKQVFYPEDGTISAGSIRFRDQTISITYTLSAKAQAFVFNQQLSTLEEVNNDLQEEEQSWPVFHDVGEDHWARKSIEWAYKQGITVGYPDQTFRPNQQVSEAEFITMFFRAFETIPKSSGKHWADGVYQLAQEKNYPVQGLTDLKQRNIPLLREQVAQIIVASQGFQFNVEDSIQYLLDHGLASGVKANEQSIENFQGKRSLTRAEAVQFIKNVNDKGLNVSSIKN